MPIRIGINGFGRMGRLALRAGWGRPGLEFVLINEIAGGPATAARAPLLNASLTDCVFEVQRPTTAEEVNGAFQARR